MVRSQICQKEDFPLEEVFHAYYEARRHKRNTASQLAFELNLEENLVALWRELNSRTYTVGTSICFMIKDTVAREVFAADFRDRVVHHLLYGRLSPFFERRFICDSYSCRKGKGTLYGINRLAHHIRSCSCNYTEECYILKLDVRGYFMHIDRRLLSNMITAALPADFPRRDAVMWLSRLIIDCEPVVNCRIKGSLSQWRELPADKSLFHSSPDCGIPIGNLTSQLFSNIYMNVFDQWIKRDCGMRHYGRYVDDFYIVHRDKSVLLALIPKIRDFLRCNLGLELHSRKVYLQNVCKGVRFLGSVVYPYHIVPSKSLLKKIRNRYSLIERGFYSPVPMRSIINSYFGFLRHCCAVNFIKHLLNIYGFPYRYGYYLRRYCVFVYKLYRRGYFDSVSVIC